MIPGAGTASVEVPSLVRIKPGALDRLGRYVGRLGRGRVTLVRSAGLPPAILDRAQVALASDGVEIVHAAEVDDASLAVAAGLLADLPGRCDAVVALGGGRAVDVAKHVASIAALPFVAAPTSLSHDGFASPLASLRTATGRRSLPCRPPAGVVVDTAVCLAAPLALWLSGLGDVAAKVTAVADWKLAFHARGEPVNDFAALLSDATVHQLASSPRRDLEGTRLLATALLLDGVAMSIAGTSRPASGSEHLVSHALDRIADRPRLHGLQVGLAAYACAQLQGAGVDRIEALLAPAGFFDLLAADPLPRATFLRAFELAPSQKSDFYTVLSSRDVRPELVRLLAEDPHLARCVTATAPS